MGRKKSIPYACIIHKYIQIFLALFVFVAQFGIKKQKTGSESQIILYLAGMMSANVYKVIGMMSGTSLDGIDLLAMKLTKKEDWSYELLTAETLPYPPSWIQELRQAHILPKPVLYELNDRYTLYVGEQYQNFKNKHNLTDIDLFCSHGHTIWHRPQEGVTLQIGNLPSLATYTQETVVCDFRTQDVMYGGQGAPLVPIGDQILFSDYEYCLNLGGYANISYDQKGNRTAFDICPVNTVLNYLSRKEGLDYDENGQLAASGTLIPELYDDLERLSFYTTAPPKSLGTEWLEGKFMPTLVKYENSYSTSDLLCTCVRHMAHQIARILNNKIQQTGIALVTGGGAYNTFLISSIQELTTHHLHIPDDLLCNYKEALIFGLLGVLRYRNEVNCLRSVTGATRDHSSGVIYVKE